MSAHPALTCFLIGGDTLLIECGDVLLDKQFVIQGVITAAPRIQQWARKKAIPVIEYKAGYENALKGQTFDYLFSITHLALIKEEVLALPAKGAINFHDGPLPAYAGLNAPAWALMNGETRYGISWHTITAGVDKGDLLKQAMFDISADETSLSINTKCFAAALESFPVLIDELVNGTSTPSIQDMSQRSYFGKFERPEGHAFLQWSQSAAKLEALVRALDFGDYPNLLTLPKISIGGRIFAVQSAVARESDTAMSPGQIIELDEGLINVATSEGVLSLTRLKALNGTTYSPGELKNLCALKVGDYFDVINSERIEALTAIGDRLARNDDYWARHLAYLDPVELPYTQSDAQLTQDERRYESLAIAVPEGLAAAIPNVATSNTISVAFALLLARLSRKTSFDLAMSTSAMVDDSAVLPGAFSGHNVLHLDMDLKMNATQVIEGVAAQIGSAAERGAWSQDIVARTPLLAAIPELVSGTALPMGIALDNVQVIPGTVMTLCAGHDGKTELHFDPERLERALAEKFAAQFVSVLRQITAAPSASAAAFELLTEEEKAQILGQWNATEVTYDNNACLHHLFECGKCPGEIDHQLHRTAQIFLHWLTYKFTDLIIGYTNKGVQHQGDFPCGWIQPSLTTRVAIDANFFRDLFHALSQQVRQHIHT